MSAIALTGGTGFVGSQVLRRLIGRGRHVRALTRRPQPEQPGVDWVIGTLSDERNLASLCDGADAVIHVAGVTGALTRADFDAANCLGTAAILRAASETGVDRFVHISSLAAREPGLSMYCASKRVGEDLVMRSSVDWTVIRPPAVYGPGDTELLDVFRLAARGLVLLPPAGRLSLIHTDDLARLIVTLAERRGDREILEPDDGKEGGWRYDEFAKLLGDAVGRRVFALNMPQIALRLAARGDRLLRGKRAKLTPDRAAYLCHPDWVVSSTRRPAPDVWQPAIASAAGLAQTARTFRDAGLLG